MFSYIFWIRVSKFCHCILTAFCDGFVHILSCQVLKIKWATPNQDIEIDFLIVNLTGVSQTVVYGQQFAFRVYFILDTLGCDVFDGVPAVLFLFFFVELMSLEKLVKGSSFRLQLLLIVSDIIGSVVDISSYSFRNKYFSFQNSLNAQF